ncbi:MAG: UDP-N-acetylmuramoyl-tripeptide--D-alanyl-D-alanine ligase [Lentimonas sp.]|jgi:UDP-N-acetylmuramoyl-tripeptide--D-alanyl-D-alanine ligase
MTQILWKISEIKLALKEQIISINDENITINQVIIDSRIKTQNGLFIAFKGENNDGHKYLKSAFENGCIRAVVDRIPEGFEGDERLILVKNSIVSLDGLAIFSRNRSKAKIIALTGSVGKTSVKEMLKKVFQTQGKTWATIGNFNNEFGLPLSLCNMQEDVAFGILEMGMNHLGEIEKLSKITRPHIAIVTNVCAAHIGNFKNEEEIALAKSEIFIGLEKNGFAIINADNKHFDSIKNQAALQKISNENIVSFGAGEVGDIRLLEVNETENCQLEINVKAKSGQKLNYLLNSINQATVFNSLIAVSCLELIGNNFELGLEALNDLETPKGRGNLISAQKNGLKFTVIDDTYNANSASMLAGLRFLSDLKKHKNGNSRSIAFVGDMLELGEFSKEEHSKIANEITEKNIDLVLLVGNEMQDLTTQIDSKKIIGHFLSSKEAVEKVNFTPQDGDIIFIKGSRGVQMEKLRDAIIN